MSSGGVNTPPGNRYSLGNGVYLFGKKKNNMYLNKGRDDHWEEPRHTVHHQSLNILTTARKDEMCHQLITLENKPWHYQTGLLFYNVKKTTEKQKGT